VGSVACGGSAGCEVVQTSPYAVFLGIPVPVWGLVGYSLLFVLAFATVQWPHLAGRLDRWMMGLSSLALLFSLYLTALELWVIHAICRWCVASQIIILLYWGLSLTLRYGLPEKTSGSA
ncbi:MAG: vitamin K epoxide reductase family protein, partial [Candidatus Hydrothermae bacterium]|nr:vitamin K epoxide reductase family protein [Candidatus Hydrothermae bacterium]